MMRILKTILTVAVTMLMLTGAAEAELLAMVNYESKPDNPLRREGIAIMDLDPDSPSFGQILADIPLPPDLIAHHIYYDKDVTKAYVTALGKPELHVLDLTRYPYRMKVIPVDGCLVGEDMAFSENLGRWYLTCMGSSRVIVGDQNTDQPIDAIDLPKPYPHGIAIHEGIDRMLVTSTANPLNPGDAGEHIPEIELSTHEVIAAHKVSNKPSPSGAAPVEVFFVPGVNPPMVYVTNMFAPSLWIGEWQPEAETFAFREHLDFAPLGQGVPLEVYFNKDATRAFVSTALPGHLNIFDISDPHNPELLKTVKTAAGSHHMVFSPDERLAFVQNSLMNLPGMNDGSISIVDLVEGELIGSIDTLKNAGYNPNSIILLPEFGGGHAH